MGLVTQQSFQEAVDGSRTVFTTQQSVDPDSIQVFQGNLPLAPTAYIALSSTQIQTLDVTSQDTWICDASNPATVYSQAHGLSASTILQLWSSVDGGLPSGLSAGQEYYVLAVDADRFQLSLTDGGVAVSFLTDSNGVLTYSKLLAPQVPDGALWYNAVTLGAVIDPTLTVGFWVIQNWQDQYAPLAALITIVDVLNDADLSVQSYVTSASYSSAEAQTEPPYSLFRRVIGELAFFYLSRRPGGVQQIKSSSKEYGDSTKKMSQTYNTSISSLMKMSEKDILMQLIDYREAPEEIDFTDEHPYTRTWGTGRNFGIITQTRSTSS